MKINYKTNLKKEVLIKLYLSMLKPRMIEEKMLLLLRQGKISKWFSGIGQEAISVGVTNALRFTDHILPMHRNLGVFTSRGINLDKLFLQFQGKKDGFTKGRDRSFHFGSNDHNLVGMISHLGPQMGVANGIALSNKLTKKNNITAVFTGEGGTSEGDFHEALNVASVWGLPVIFIIENNGYGLSTPVSEQYNCKSLSDRGKGYGITSFKIDGNNILDVYNTVKNTVDLIQKKSQPILIECNTFRMRGHEEASGTKYVPEKLMSKWAKKDPLDNYQKFLLKNNYLDSNDIDKYKSLISDEIDKGLDIAFNTKELVPDAINEYNDVYRKYNFIKQKTINNKVSNIRLVDAISNGLKQCMDKYDNLIIMGQDIAEYGGVFKITEGFLDLFGKERVRNTPICESIILSMGLGLSVKGFKSVIEMQFADFVSSGFNAVVNNLAKTHYRWGQNVDVVVRMPTGANVNAGPFHSQSNESWFIHTPGLKVVYPSSPADAKGLLISSIEDPNPVMFFEHKFLYRSLYEDVPDSYYNIELGKAKRILEGNDVTVITYGYGVHIAKEVLSSVNDISADLIDLRTLVPLDKNMIFESVKKTNKVIILHEDTLTGGFGAEVSSLISEFCFEYLDAPIVRAASMDTPVPFAANLENQFLPKDRFKKKLLDLLNY